MVKIMIAARTDSEAKKLEDMDGYKFVCDSERGQIWCTEASLSQIPKVFGALLIAGFCFLNITLDMSEVTSKDLMVTGMKL